MKTLLRITLCLGCFSLPATVVPAAAHAHAHAPAHAPARADAATPVNANFSGARDFDFEIGRWQTHLRRLAHPLSGSTDWVQYEGTTTVRKVWEGRANLVELDVSGPAG